jgi:hypothetical protein
MTHNPYGGPDPYGHGTQPDGGTQPGQPQSPASGYPFGPSAPDQGAAAPFADSWDPTAGQPEEYFSPSPAGPQPDRRRRTLLIVGISALALIILGVGSAIVVMNLLQASNGEQRTGGSTSPSSSAAPAAGARPSDAVLGYLTALASGDAQEALAYGQSRPTESSLLSDKALSTALKEAPLTAIEVPQVDGQNEAVVEASYKLGKRAVTETFDVVKQEDAWKLRRVAAELELGLVRSGAVPLLINGTKVSANLINLFPGSYEIGTGLKYSDYGNESTILVTSPSGFPDTSRLGVRINAKGKAAAVAATKKSYTKCLKSDDPAPAKCPNRWTSDETRWRKGSVDWNQQGSDPFKNAEVTTSGLFAQVQIPLRVELSGTCTQGGRTGRCVGAEMSGTSISVVSLETNSPKVRWLPAE